MTHPRISATAYRVPMDLTEFLLERIAEDEAVARKPKTQVWLPDGRWVDSRSTDEYGRLCSGVTVFAHEPNASKADIKHIARWDPARVLAECEAKRRIVEACVQLTERVATFEYYGITQDEGILRVLASVYADYPDYREEWKP